MTKYEKKLRNISLNEAPKRCLLEEIGNAVTHGVGALIATLMMLLMLNKSTNGLMIMASLFYGISMIIMMVMSSLYHSFKHGSRVKRLWRRFDYASIYLLIGGTYAPLFLVYLGNTLGIVLFIIQWFFIIVGITFIAIFGPGRIKWLHYLLYFLVGWSGVLFIPKWIISEVSLMSWILFGGIVYTIGFVLYAVGKKKKWFHSIWHLFVLIASIMHFISILIMIFR